MCRKEPGAATSVPSPGPARENRGRRGTSPAARDSSLRPGPVPQLSAPSFVRRSVGGPAPILHQYVSPSSELEDGRAKAHRGSNPRPSASKERRGFPPLRRESGRTPRNTVARGGGWWSPLSSNVKILSVAGPFLPNPKPAVYSIRFDRSNGSCPTACAAWAGAPPGAPIPLSGGDC
jgi:hypothetical protein